MYQRINITLPNETLQLLDRIASKDDRSHFIDQAVKYYINAEAKENLREKLKKAAFRWAKRALGITKTGLILMRNHGKTPTGNISQER
jgi:CopG family transcriptional regulator/antitoxin EndoAI